MMAGGSGVLTVCAELGAMAADSEGEAWMLARTALFVLGDIGVLSCLTVCGLSCVLAEDCTDVQFEYPAGMPAGRAEST